MPGGFDSYLFRQIHGASRAPIKALDDSNILQKQVLEGTPGNYVALHEIGPKRHETNTACGVECGVMAIT